MNNHYKTTEVLKSLKRLDFHRLFELSEADGVDVFRLNYNTNGVDITMIIALDDSNWSLIRYYIAECYNPIKKEQILDLLNELNKTRRSKYFIDHENNIISEIQLPSADESFDADQLVHIAIIFLKEIEKNDYSKIMRVLWS